MDLLALFTNLLSGVLGGVVVFFANKRIQEQQRKEIYREKLFDNAKDTYSKIIVYLNHIHSICAGLVEHPESEELIKALSINKKGLIDLYFQEVLIYCDNDIANGVKLAIDMIIKREKKTPAEFLRDFGMLLKGTIEEIRKLLHVDPLINTEAMLKIIK